MFKLKLKIQSGENWYGGDVPQGFRFPLTRKSFYKRDNRVVLFDQSTPFLISNRGRYIWSEQGFRLRCAFGRLTLTGDAPIALYRAGTTLREAYLDAQGRFFPPDGNMPDETMFRVPQYCTWIELMTNQTQQGILDYARSILDSGMPAGELIIDDGWQNSFGDWEFHPGKFSDPAAMTRQLKEMGFKVILWICPFIAPESRAFAALKERGLLVKDSRGEIAMRAWWNGVSAVLDMSNPAAAEWFYELCDGLTRRYGIDGFKQDAGDACYYRDDDKTFGGTDANGQSYLWMKSALRFPFNELRASWKGGGVGVAQRLGDKAHSWEDGNGLRSLIPNALQLGITGHRYCCPDMIGGGLASNFTGKGEEALDTELFVRSAQCSALMPMMQYSRSIWRFKDGAAAKAAIAACEIHRQFADYIVETARAGATSGEPVIRLTEYVFPEPGAANARFQFMLGDKYLVAPVVHKGAVERTAYLPRGKWRYLPDGSEFEGGRSVTVPAPLDTLPVFQYLSR